VGQRRDPGPRGIGTAIAIDWGLTVEFLTLAVLALAGNMPPRVAGLSGQWVRGAEVVALLVAAAAFFVQGEALRRGRLLAWQLQVGLNVLLLPVGVFQLVDLLAGIGRGHVPSLSSAIILIVINPIVVWLLTRPSTRAWARTTTPQAAAARHGSLRWLGTIGFLAVVGGIAVALGI
jgi:hypothetical protein